MEWCVSARGLGLAFLALSALLALAAWVRPPLSRDIPGYRISLGLFPSDHAAIEESLAGRAPLVLDSPGLLLWLACAVGCTVVLLWPNRLHLVAGAVVALSLAGSAAVALNHPILIERLELELEQRARLVRLLDRVEESTISAPPNRRIKAEPALEEERTGLFRGFLYLQYGPWLVVLSGLAVILSGRGRLRYRCGLLLAWLMIGVVLGAALTSRRLLAEWHWYQAAAAERQGDLGAARASLARAVAHCPDLNELGRTWLLIGKLDHRDGRSSPQAEYWRALQLARNRDPVAAMAAIEHHWRSTGSDRAVGRLAGRILAVAGVEHFQRKRFVAARDAWHAALEYCPEQLDCRCYLGLVTARLDRQRPERVEAELAPVLDRLADRALRADLLAILGDAHFEAGRMNEARRRYTESLKAFNLPKVINYRALAGLVGM